MDEEIAESLLATARVTRDELAKMIEKTVTEEVEKEVALERPLFDEGALDEDAGPSEEAVEAAEAAEAVPAAEGDIFEGFPEGEAEDKPDEEDEPKVNPFANTELDD